MRILFAGVILFDILVIGGGFLQGWFPFSSPSAVAEHSEDNFNLEVDTGKTKEDRVMSKIMTATPTDKYADDVTEPIAR